MFRKNKNPINNMSIDGEIVPGVEGTYPHPETIGDVVQQNKRNVNNIF